MISIIGYSLFKLLDIHYVSYLATQGRHFQIHAGLMLTGLFSKSDQELSNDIYIVWFGDQKVGTASRRKFLAKNQNFSL